MDKNVQKFWDNEPWRIPGTTWDITGYSRAAYRTGFYIKCLDLMIDAGPQKMGNPKTILITHCHGDHMANIPFTLIKKGDRGVNEDYSNVFVPSDAKEHLENYICAMFHANFNQKFPLKVANWFPVKEGYSIDYESKNQKIKINVYKCFHDVPTVSYGLSSLKNRLKPEFQKLKGDSNSLKNLRKEGIVITEQIYEKAIVFVWDTKIEVFQNKEILEYPVVMVECTFFKEDELEVSKEKSHIHWNDLKPIVLEHPEIMFVLVHFSMRYKEQEIIDFFENEDLRNVKPWVLEI
jgi:ribonuclease Z